MLKIESTEPRVEAWFAHACVYCVLIQWRGGTAEGGRPNNAAWISTVSRSWAGVIWAAFFRCSVEHYNSMCTRITCITHKGHVCTLNESLTQSNSRLLADHVIV